MRPTLPCRPGLVTRGYLRGDERYINAGLLVVAIGLLTRYVDVFWSLLAGSAFFIIGGLLLLAVAFALERMRRGLVRAMSGRRDRSERGAGMIPRLTPAKKLLIIVGIQFLVLLSVIGFKQYAVWTGETVLLKTTPSTRATCCAVTSWLLNTRSRRSISIRSRKTTPTAADGLCRAQRGDDGYWDAVAMHGRRRHAFAGTVLLRGDIERYYGSDEGRLPSDNIIRVHYGIEQIFVPEGSGGDLPSGREHVIAVELKVDRFGNAVPRRFFVDGQPFDLRRR